MSQDRLVVCAIVPARGGSRGVPRKNLRTVGGVPLVARAVHALRSTATIDSVHVSTDDHEIAAVAIDAGADVVVRPAELAGDTASSESAVEHALSVLHSRNVFPDVVLLVQATSPFIDPHDVDRAVRLVAAGHDVAFSATPTDAHLWRIGPDGAVAVNHDAAVRLRRQDREAEFRETGAFYAMRADGFLRHRHRFFGRIGVVEVSPLHAIDVDAEHDLVLAEALEPAPPSPIPARAVVTDFDGVHTRDRVVVDQAGVESVEVNRSDGMGVARLRRRGIPFLILSGEQNPVVEARARKLGVEVVAGCDDKLTALRSWAGRHAIDLADVTYLGNDVNDVDCLHAVGWPAVVADAHPDARRASRIVLRRGGGGGAVRELADRVLASTGRSDPDEKREGDDHE